MGARNWRLIGLLVAAGLVVALGSAIAAEGDGEGDEVAVTGGDQELVDRLVALQDELPPLVPTEADLALNELDPVLLGSFTSARSTLDRLEDEIRQLYIDGDDADTAVGDAVTSVARGLLIERQALLVLEESDGSTNPRPLDSSNARNDEGVALDADGLLGLETVGIDLLIQAHDLRRLGYEVLEEVEGVDGVFATQLDELLVYENEVGITLRVATSASTDELLVPVERYEAPVGVPRATSVTYVCVDRFRYIELADLPMAERVAASVEDVPSQECTDIARRAGLSLEDQEALVEPDEADAGAEGGSAADTDEG